VIRKSIINLFNKLGYRIIKIPDKPFHEQETLQVLTKIKSWGINPDRVIDLGAAQGRWTSISLQVWPNARHYLIEPLVEQVEKAETFLKSAPNITIINAAAGEKSGTISINITPDLDGSGIYGNAADTREVKQIQLDDLVDKKNETGQSCLIKFDTHGYELPILAGAPKLLSSTSCIIMEVYGFDISPTTKRFPEMCRILEDKGFRLADIFGIMRRPGDNAFWQADAVFLREDNSIFNSNDF